MSKYRVWVTVEEEREGSGAGQSFEDVSEPVCILLTSQLGIAVDIVNAIAREYGVSGPGWVMGLGDDY